MKRTSDVLQFSQSLVAELAIRRNTHVDMTRWPVIVALRVPRVQLLCHFIDAWPAGHCLSLADWLVTKHNTSTAMGQIGHRLVYFFSSLVALLQRDS